MKLANLNCKRKEITNEEVIERLKQAGIDPTKLK